MADRNKGLEGVTSPQEFLGNRLETYIKLYQERRQRYRRWAFFLRMSVVFLGALTTILLGIKEYDGLWTQDPKNRFPEQLFSAIALGFSALIPVILAIETFFDFRWRWLRYTATLHEFNSVRFELEYQIAKGKQISIEVLDELHKRVQVAFAETNEEWLRKKHQDEKNRQRHDSLPRPH
jgi:hypothetical protein